MTEQHENEMTTGIKSYITPGLIAIIGWFLITLFVDVKTDIKTILRNDITQETKDKFFEKEIESLKVEIKELKETIIDLKLKRGISGNAKKNQDISLIVDKNKLFVFNSKTKQFQYV